MFARVGDEEEDELGDGLPRSLVVSEPNHDSSAVWLFTLGLAETLVVGLAFIAGWVLPEAWLAWRGVPRRRIEERQEQPEYPESGSDAVISAALAQMAAVDAQANALDQKLGVVAAVSGALIAILPAVLADPTPATGPAEGPGPAELRAGMAALAMFIAALVHSLRGLWPQQFDLGPNLRVVREQFMDRFPDEQVKWAMAASLDHSIELNSALLRPKLAALRLGFGATVSGVAFTVVAAIAHFA